MENIFEVRSYFRERGKVAGTERCCDMSEAKTFAVHQLKYFPYVEVVSVLGIVHPWGFEVRREEVLFRFR